MYSYYIKQPQIILGKSFGQVIFLLCAIYIFFSKIDLDTDKYIACY